MPRALERILDVRSEEHEELGRVVLLEGLVRHRQLGADRHERLRVEHGAQPVTQVGKRALELGEDGRALAGRGRRREQPVAEGGHHEELLQRRVHVARRALVDQTGVRRAQLAARSDAPLGVCVAHVRALEAREERAQVGRVTAGGEQHGQAGVPHRVGWLPTNADADANPAATAAGHCGRGR